jgi:predicted deacylase
VRAGTSGIVSGKAKLGSTVKTGQRLAIISDPLGEAEEAVLAPFDGIVIGRSNLPLAHEGDALFNLSSFSNVPKAADVVETFASTNQDPPVDD